MAEPLLRVESLAKRFGGIVASDDIALVVEEGELHAVIGAVALLVLEEALSRVTEYWPIILGPLILLVVLYARGGIDGILARLGRG